MQPPGHREGGAKSLRVVHLIILQWSRRGPAPAVLSIAVATLGVMKQIAISGSVSKSLKPLAPTFSGTDRFESVHGKLRPSYSVTYGCPASPVRKDVVGAIFTHPDIKSRKWLGGGKRLVY